MLRSNRVLAPPPPCRYFGPRSVADRQPDRGSETMRFAKAGLAGVALGALALALVAATGGARAAGDMVLTVTIESVTTPTTLKLPDGGGAPAPLSPGVAYAGKEVSPFFTLGKPASKGLQMQAEAGRDPRRSRAARARVRRRAPRGDRDRPAAPRPRRLPLAHARADRGGAVVALARGRRHPLQGGGVGVDASAVQLQQVWVDPDSRNRGDAKRALRDLFRLLLAQVRRSASSCVRRTPRRSGSTRAIGMRRTISYRSLIF